MILDTFDTQYVANDFAYVGYEMLWFTISVFTLYTKTNHSSKHNQLFHLKKQVLLSKTNKNAKIMRNFQKINETNDFNLETKFVQ